jgi:vacuolar iron transporter family protein
MITPSAAVVVPRERHRSERIAWLRAAVLGANDGIVSTASLVIGIAAAQADRRQILVAGVAGLVAGAMSMAAGEYVSVSTQRDTEAADLVIELTHLESDPIFERDELAEIYVARGLSPQLARDVAEQLMAHDALGAHARDELGFSHVILARPVMPLAAAAIAPDQGRAVLIAGASLIFLAALGAIAARAGGAPPSRGALRVTFWGALAMAFTAIVGWLFGVAIA